MKKILSTIFVFLLVALSGLTLFACGSDVDKNNIYSQADEFFKQVEQDRTEDGMFAQSDMYVSGVQTDFAITIFLTNINYSYLNQLFVLPMNYLQEYYPDLQDLEAIDSIPSEGQQAINNFSYAIQNLQTSYIDCKDVYETHKDLLTLNNDVVIREGALAIFNRYYKVMLQNVYDAAEALVKIKEAVFKDYRGLEQTNFILMPEDSKQLRDYFVLEASKIYYDLFVNKLEMKDFTNRTGTADIVNFAALNRGMKNNLNDLFDIQSEESFTQLVGKEIKEGEDILAYDNVQVVELFKIYDIMQNEYQVFQNTLEKFNLVKFYENFSCSIEAYEKELPYAELYFNEIDDYINIHTNNYLTALYNTLIGE